MSNLLVVPRTFGGTLLIVIGPTTATISVIAVGVDGKVAGVGQDGQVTAVGSDGQVSGKD